MKTTIAGLISSIFGFGNSSSGLVYTNPNGVKRITNKTSLWGWNSAKPSEYFGERSKIVTAFTPKGTRQMKLKNALKKGFEFQF